MENVIRDENGYIVRYMTDEEWNEQYAARFGEERPMTDEEYEREKERVLSGTSGFGELYP
jgi:hypothetical protein